MNEHEKRKNLTHVFIHLFVSHPALVASIRFVHLNLGIFYNYLSIHLPLSFIRSNSTVHTYRDFCSSEPGDMTPPVLATFSSTYFLSEINADYLSQQMTNLYTR